MNWPLDRPLLRIAPRPNRWLLAFWGMLAAGFGAGALVLGPWIIPPLNEEQEKFREILEAGIRVVRWDLAIGAVLALVSLAFWRRGNDLNREPVLDSPRTLGTWIGALALAVLVAVLAVPRLDSTLWWDELSTLTRIVKRGPVVILTYSADGNNHILNSLLQWASIRAFGENETVLHFVPFLFALATVQLLYWTLRHVVGAPAAFLIALIAAIHPWIINHGVEARGYAGAIFFSSAAALGFAHLITKGSPRQTVLYIAACVAAFGFVSTMILVPFGHGLAACLLLLAGFRWPKLSPYRANAVNLIFACLWVAVLAGLFFGFPLPQTLSYARHLAEKDHLPLGMPLGEEMLNYMTGLSKTPAAGLFMSVAVVGWGIALRRGSPQRLRLFMTGSLIPLAAVVFFLLLPGTRSSARFFCFLILPVCSGIGITLAWLMRTGMKGRLVAGVLMALFLGLLIWEHHRLLAINRPNLKSLAEELQEARIVLMGAQADLNVYYFPQATVYQESQSDTATLQEAVKEADVIVEGRARKDNLLNEPDPALIALGFQVQETLPSAFEGGTEYLVYRRGKSSEAPRNR